MKKAEIQKIANDIVETVNDTKAVFFMNKTDVKIPSGEVISELRNQICTNVEMYFYKMLNK